MGQHANFLNPIKFNIPCWCQGCIQGLDSFVRAMFGSAKCQGNYKGNKIRRKSGRKEKIELNLTYYFYLLLLKNYFFKLVNIKIK